MSKELVVVLKVVLANTYAYSGMAQGMHWNVKGPNFSEYHGFFGGIYDDAYDQVDRLAEYIRIQGQPAPTNIPEILKAQTIADVTEVKQAMEMIKDLQTANKVMVDSYTKLFSTATKAGAQDIANYAADRMDVHNKQAWMIRSYLEG